MGLTSGKSEIDVPLEVWREVERQQAAMGWPKMVPKYAEIPQPDGEPIWKAYHSLTVADFEQLVESHARKAREQIKRWIGRGYGPCRAAGRHVLLARLYRCGYLSLIGKEDSTEDDMPFPVPVELRK